MAKKNQFKISDNIITAALYIIVGILFCIFKAGVLNFTMTVIGALLIVAGVLRILKKQLTEGIIFAALGVLIILGGWLFVDVILLVLGVFLAAKGVLDLLTAIKYNNLAATVSSAITILVGIMLVVSKWALLDWIFIILGVILAVDGVILLAEKDGK